MPRSFRQALAAMILLAWPGSGWGQDSPTSVQALVPAQFTSKQDAQGFAWGFDGQTVRGEGNPVFRNAGMIQVNGSGLSFTNQPMMTPDGNEYVVSANAGNVAVSRRIRFDSQNATVRFVETFQNPTTSPMPLNVQVGVNMTTSGATVIGDAAAARTAASGGAGPSGPPIMMPGQPGMFPGGYSHVVAAPAALGERDCGLLVMPRRNPGTALLLYLSSPRSPVKPSVRGESSNYQLYFTYSVVVPPQKSLSLVYGIAQRRLSGEPLAKSAARLFAPFKTTQWTRDLPKDLRGTLANIGRSSSEEIPAGPRLAAVLQLAEEYDVERGPADVLVQNRDAKIAGQVEGAVVDVTTSFGPTTVSLGDVAAVRGGAGVDQGMRVYLRNGEVLCGRVVLKDMVLKTEVGLTVPLDARHIHLLFLRADPKDMQPAVGTALLACHSGDRLALAPDGTTKVSALTAWGPIQVPLADLRRIVAVKEPQPMHRLFFRDGSRLSAILTGDELELKSLRFGAFKLTSRLVAGLEASAPEKAAAAKNASDPEEPSGADGEELKGAHCQLAGDNLLVGTLDGPELKVATPAGVAAVVTSRVRSLESDEAAEVKGQIMLEFSDGSRLVGLVPAPTIPIRALGRVWQIPVEHLVAYRHPAEKPAEEAVEKPAEGGAPPIQREKRPAKRTVPRPPLPPPADNPFGAEPVPDDPFGAPATPRTMSSPPAKAVPLRPRSS